MLTTGTAPVLVAIGNTPKINASEVIESGVNADGRRGASLQTGRGLLVHLVSKLDDQDGVFRR